MKAKDLIEQLEFTEEAEIIIMSQAYLHPRYYQIRNSEITLGEDNKTYIVLEDGGPIGSSFGKPDPSAAQEAADARLAREQDSALDSNPNQRAERTP